MVKSFHVYLSHLSSFLPVTFPVNGSNDKCSQPIWVKPCWHLTPLHYSPYFIWKQKNMITCCPTYFASLKPAYLIAWNPTYYRDDIHENEWCIHKYVCQLLWEVIMPIVGRSSYKLITIKVHSPITNLFNIEIIHLSTANLYSDSPHNTCNVLATFNSFAGK